MKNVKVDRFKLKAAVQKNRDVHRKIFLDAQKGYRKAVIRELDRMLKDARSGKRFATMVMLPAPQDHTEDYDRVLLMLEMSVDEVIELDFASFDQYVRDNWHWKQSFGASNSAYMSGSTKSLAASSGYEVD